MKENIEDDTAAKSEINAIMAFSQSLWARLRAAQQTVTITSNNSG